MRLSECRWAAVMLRRHPRRASSPPGLPEATVRRSIHDVSVAEQRRFLRSWGNMIDKGIEGEYAKLVAMHSYSDPPSFA